MANKEKDDLPELLNSSAVESLSDDIISLNLSRSVIPPPRNTLTSEIETDDHAASDLVPVDGCHVTEEDDGVVSRVLDDSFYRRRMVSLGGGSRYGIGDCINSDGDITDEDDCNDLDDELVPWSVSKKVKRQRLWKLGKRCSYMQLKRGCVRGKHGFGINFRC